jgi:hypothetical protein
MSKKRFDKAFAKFIRQGEEKIKPQTFFQVLAEIERERAQKTIELQAAIIDGQLRFAPSPELSVRANEILVGNQRIIVRVSSGD